MSPAVSSNFDHPAKLRIPAFLVLLSRIYFLTFGLAARKSVATVFERKGLFVMSDNVPLSFDAGDTVVVGHFVETKNFYFCVVAAREVGLLDPSFASR